MTTYPHPACMEPDGAEPCRGYVALNEALDAHKIMLAESSLREGDLLNRLYELDAYRERYEKLREALIDALGPQADTLISLAIAPVQPTT